MREKDSLLIIGSFGGNNAGDLLILDSVIISLRDIGFAGTILIPTPKPNELREIYKDPAIEFINTSWKKGAFRFFSPQLFKRVGKITHVISTAGIFFDRRLFNPSINFILSMWMMQKAIAVKSYINRVEQPGWIGFCVGISQPASKLGRRIMRDVLQRHSLIITRDRNSSEIVRQLTIDSIGVPLVDATWNPLLDESLQTIDEKSPFDFSDLANRNIVAINPNRYWENRIGQHDAIFYDLILYLREHGYEAVWFCTSIGDEYIARRVNEAYAIEIDLFGLSTLNHRQLFHMARRFKLVVGSRLHGCLIPLIQGTPAIALAYDPKVSNAFAELDLGEYVIHPTIFNKEILIETTANALRERNRYLDSLDKSKRKAYHAFGRAKQLLAESM